MFNQVILLGNLGSNPERVNFDNGGFIVKAPIATSEKWKDKTTGEVKEETTWHNLVFHGKQAEAVEQYAGKGSTLQIIGRIKNRSWETPQGEKRYATDIMVRSFNFVGKRPEGAGNSSQSGYDEYATAEEKDDLPF